MESKNVELLFSIRNSY